MKREEKKKGKEEKMEEKKKRRGKRKKTEKGPRAKAVNHSAVKWNWAGNVSDGQLFPACDKKLWISDTRCFIRNH